MKAEIKFEGSLEDFFIFTKNYEKTSSVSATIIVGNETLEQKARSAASLHSGKIQAIKAVREVTGWGLLESKTFVETLPQFPPFQHA